VRPETCPPGEGLPLPPSGSPATDEVSDTYSQTRAHLRRPRGHLQDGPSGLPVRGRLTVVIPAGSIRRNARLSTEGVSLSIAALGVGSLEVVLLAVTKMGLGFCMAGMTGDGEWVRPVPIDRHSWQADDLIHGQDVVGPGVILILKDAKHSPNPPHVEDYMAGDHEVSGHLSRQEFRLFLREKTEGMDALKHLLDGDGRSLCLVRPESFQTVHVEDDARKTRIAFEFSGQSFENDTQKPGFPCTDLRWRASRGSTSSDPKYEEAFLTLGLARAFQGSSGWVKPAPMVIGVHVFPSTVVKLDAQSPETW
jgi:hypothetical protein